MRFVPLLALFAMAAPAYAQDKGADTSPAKEKMICRRSIPTGSILGSKRVCHTKAEWAKISERSRNDRDARERSTRVGNSGVIGD